MRHLPACQDLRSTIPVNGDHKDYCSHLGCMGHFEGSEVVILTKDS